MFYLAAFAAGLASGLTLAYFYGHSAVNTAHAELIRAQATATRIANKL